MVVVVQSQAQFNTYLARGTVLNNYAHIFDILIRLRQAVDHPYLVIHSDAQQSATEARVTAAAASSATAAECECDLCHDPLEQGVKSKCGHWFCKPCIQDYISSVGANTVCPTCSKPLTIQLDSAEADEEEEEVTAKPATKKRGSAKAAASSSSSSSTSAIVAEIAPRWRKKSILNRVDLGLFQSSTKMEALMQELHVMQSADLGAKAIVFSQFVNMLDVSGDVCFISFVASFHGVVY